MRQAHGKGSTSPCWYLCPRPSGCGRGRGGTVYSRTSDQSEAGCLERSEVKTSWRAGSSAAGMRAGKGQGRVVWRCARGRAWTGCGELRVTYKQVWTSRLSLSLCGSLLSLRSFSRPCHFKLVPTLMQGTVSIIEVPLERETKVGRRGGQSAEEAQAEAGEGSFWLGRSPPKENSSGVEAVLPSSPLSRRSWKKKLVRLVGRR